MGISGFSMCRNADLLYYPIKESILSALPIVDEFVVAVGKGKEEDNTLQLLESIDSDKLRIVHTKWDLNKYPDGTVHAQQPDFAKSFCSGDWLLYLQADEILHEDDHKNILDSSKRFNGDQKVEALVFDYLHFWGDYTHLVNSHGWYPREIRMVKNQKNIHSWESAQSFRYISDFDGVSYRRKTGSRKLFAAHCDARIFHYGWVRPPKLVTEKMLALDEIHSHPKPRFSGDFQFGNMSNLDTFDGSHPEVMEKRIASLDWQNQLTSDPVVRKYPFKHERMKNRLITKLEKTLLGGEQIMSFKNYTLVD
ncbi:MAG: hypothetical protein GWP27_06355 [Bacteroidetes bacterium]|nr:hypothetical protein [Bacteroidota bacterium]